MRLDRRAWLASLLPLCASGSACTFEPAEFPDPAPPPDWNPREITWSAHAEGLAAARARGQPIVLVLYTDWCPHCHNYSRAFHEPEVVRLARRFVMIRIERDANPELSERYDLDGEYIPRTFFLTPTGEVLTELRSHNPVYHYFLDEHDPAELVTLMRRALGLTRPASPASVAD